MKEEGQNKYMAERQSYHLQEVPRRSCIRRCLQIVGGVYAIRYSFDEFIDPPLRHKEFAREVEAHREWFDHHYGITVGPVDSGNDAYMSWNRIGNIKRAAESVRTVRKAFEKYPPDLLKNLNTKSIYLVESLKYSGANLGGIYLGSSIFVNCRSIGQVEENTHHELRHAVDHIDGEASVTESDWDSQNPQGFSYTGMNEFTSSPIDMLGVIRPKGFAYAYGRVSREEDKATVAGALFTDAQRILKIGQNERDIGLLNKIELTKKVYRELSGGRMNDRYWQLLEEAPHRINRLYWEHAVNTEMEKGIIQRRLELRERRMA